LHPLFEKKIRAFPELQWQSILADHLENLEKEKDMRRALLAAQLESADGRIFFQPMFWSPNHHSWLYFKDSGDGKKWVVIMPVWVSVIVYFSTVKTYNFSHIDYHLAQ
jgi:hypothetical protein